MSEQPVVFDRVTLRRFILAIKYFFTSEVRWRARGLFAILIAFALTANGLNVLNSYVGRDLMTAIEHRNQAGFIRQALIFVGVLAATTVVAVFYRFTEERLGLFWRVWLTRRIIHLYIFTSSNRRRLKTPTSESPKTFACSLRQPFLSRPCS